MKSKKGFGRILAALLACMLILSMSAVSALAATGNEAVRKDTSGVVQIKVGVKGKDNNIYYVQEGTGFLINETTVITCNHVTTFTDEDMKKIIDDFKKINMEFSAKDIKDREVIKISVMRDVAIDATVMQSSGELDIAILELKQAINGRETLAIRPSKEVGQTEDCFALGFPALVSSFDNIKTYTQNDVTITPGKVNKVSNVNIMVDGLATTAQFVISNSKIDEGNSGGPLVDGDGYVIGICQSTISGDGVDEDYYYSIASDHLIDILNPLGVKYDLAGATSVAVTSAPDDSTNSAVEPAPTLLPPEPGVDKTALDTAIAIAEQKSEKEFTPESYAVLKEALTAAKNVSSNQNATKAEVEDAQKTLETAIAGLADAKAGVSLPLIIGIIAAVVIALILIVVLMTRKKPEPRIEAQNILPPQQMGNGPAVMPAGPGVSSGTVGTSVLNDGGNATTVLNAGTETTVLNSSTTYGELVRKKTGKSVSINNDSFKIGRQQNSVDYCINDNSAIGRVHAVIIYRNGALYIKDNNSTNGTFVNDVRVKPNAEAPIAAGDKIMLGDEEFTFKAF